jgi:hypothetical protein
MTPLNGLRPYSSAFDALGAARLAADLVDFFGLAGFLVDILDTLSLSKTSGQSIGGRRPFLAAAKERAPGDFASTLLAAS